MKWYKSAIMYAGLGVLFAMAEDYFFYYNEATALLWGTGIIYLGCCITGATKVNITVNDIKGD